MSMSYQFIIDICLSSSLFYLPLLSNLYFPFIHFSLNLFYPNLLLVTSYGASHLFPFLDEINRKSIIVIDTQLLSMGHFIFFCHCPISLFLKISYSSSLNLFFLHLMPTFSHHIHKYHIFKVSFPPSFLLHFLSIPLCTSQRYVTPLCSRRTDRWCTVREINKIELQGASWFVWSKSESVRESNVRFN